MVVAPPVLAEVMNAKSEDAYLTDWGRCAFLGGEMVRENEGEKRRTRCTMHFEAREVPDSIEIVLPRKAQQFLINDGPVPLTDSRMETDALTLKLRRAGTNTVMLVY